MDNPRLGRKVLDFVTAHRDQFDMGAWGYTSHACGTTGCLAGWAMILSGYTLAVNQSSGAETFRRPDGSEVSDEGGEAQELLGLTAGERDNGSGASPLFLMYEDEAIERFRELVEASEARAAERAATAAREECRA